MKPIFPQLNNHQIDRLSEIFGNLGLVFFASIVVPVLIIETDIKMIFKGLLLSIAFWVASVLILKEERW